MLMGKEAKKLFTVFWLSSGSISPLICFNHKLAASGFKAGTLLSIPIFACEFRYAFRLIFAPGKVSPPIISTLESSSSRKKSLAIFGIFSDASSL